MTRRADLSNDFKVLVKIYEYNKIKKKPIYYKLLIEEFPDITKGEIARILEKNLDLGIINGTYEKYDKWVQTLVIGYDALCWIKEVYMSLNETKICPTCGQRIKRM